MMMHDGVSKIWILRYERGLQVEGYASPEQAAEQLLFHGCLLENEAETRARFAAFTKQLNERLERYFHEHDWVDTVEGDEIIGKHCSSCGAVYED